MKRAKMNRELGVKSMQLQKFVQKPKVVSHCRHYIMGRCYEVFFTQILLNYEICFTSYIYATYHLYSCWFLLLWLIAQYKLPFVILVLMLYLTLI